MLHHVYQFSAGKFAQKQIHVVAEMPLAIMVNGRELATMMCTPVKLRELALGFLAFERFIDSMDDVKSIEVDEEEGEVHVELNKPLIQVERRIFTSGCGGGITFHLDFHDYPPIRTSRVIDPLMLAGLIEKLTAAAVLYHQSRGIHTAALSDGNELIAVAEDVGRHNALDKLRGEVLEKGIDTRDLILVSTGRISSEMLRKAARMNVPFVVSRTSPTSLSIVVAKRLGITLIGYARPGRFNVYSHPENLGPGGVPPQEDIRRPEKAGEPLAVSPSNGHDLPLSPAVPRGLRRQRRRESEGRRKKDKKFMDVVDQAFAHQVAISVWREAEAFLEAAPSLDEGLRRLREEVSFEDRGDYGPLWRRNWLAAMERIRPSDGPDARLAVFGEMTIASMREEDEARDRDGKPRLLDEEEGQRFMDFTLGRILQEGNGEIEEIDEIEEI